jgi:protease I
MSTKIAMPVAEEFEDSEVSVPLERLRAAGHEVVLVGRRKGERLKGKKGETTVTTDAAAGDLEPGDFGALVIPGGHSPDKLRMDEDVVDFVRRFGRGDGVIAAVCHGPQLLIEADLVEGRTVTSWPSVRKDLENAGATWVDREVCEDGRLITSRKPQDLEAFCAAINRQLAGVASR